jgi:hypothetical protein
MQLEEIVQCEVPGQVIDHKISCISRKDIIEKLIDAEIQKDHYGGIENSFLLKKRLIAEEEKCRYQVSNRGMVEQPEKEYEKQPVIFAADNAVEAENYYKQHAEIHVEELPVHNHKIPDHRVDYYSGEP